MTSFASTAAMYCPKGGTPGADCEGQEWKRDGEDYSQFTAQLYTQIDPLTDFADPSISCPKSFKPDNTQLYLLSDGRCGSTCSMFSRSLQDLKYAKAVAVGGQLNTPQQIASFGGGQVWDNVETFLTGYFETIANANKAVSPWPANEKFPGGFPFAGQQFSFVPQEVQDVERTNPHQLKYPGIPQEFIFEPAGIRLHYSANSVCGSDACDAALYDEVRQRIDACGSIDCRECSGCGVNGCGLEASCDSDSWWKPWRIAVIVSAGVLFIALVVAAVYLIRKRQQLDVDESDRVRTSTELDDAFAPDPDPAPVTSDHITMNPVPAMGTQCHIALKPDTAVEDVTVQA